jgi:hypothetical protein
VSNLATTAPAGHIPQNPTPGPTPQDERPDAGEVKRSIHSEAVQLDRGEISVEVFVQNVKDELTRYLGRPATIDDVRTYLEQMRDDVIDRKNGLGPGAADNIPQRALNKIDQLLW